MVALSGNYASLWIDILKFQSMQLKNLRQARHVHIFFSFFLLPFFPALGTITLFQIKALSEFTMKK